MTERSLGYKHRVDPGKFATLTRFTHAPCVPLLSCRGYFIVPLYFHLPSDEGHPFHPYA
jgi:hypothetical protein